MGTPRTAAALALVGLALAACTTAGSTAGAGPGAGRTITPAVPSLGPGPAPAAVTPVPAVEVWGLAQLVPPAGLTVTSAVRRPDAAGMASYLLVGTTTTTGAASLCEQLGGLEPAPDGLGDADRAGWGLTEDPAGALGTCRAADPVVPSVQREVLVAEVDGSAGVWVSSFETP